MGEHLWSAYEFMQDGGLTAARTRTAHDRRSQTYLEAVEAAFGMDIDFAVLVKLYGAEAGSETRYSPAVCVGCRPRR